MSDGSIKDGKKVTAPSGAQRHLDEGKGAVHLMPPWVMLRLAKHFEDGVRQAGYEPRNWERGIKLSRFFDGVMRHLWQHWAGMDDEPHAVSALWNLVCYLETLHRVEAGLLPQVYDDRPECTMREWPQTEVVNDDTGY